MCEVVSGSLENEARVVISDDPKTCDCPAGSSGVTCVACPPSSSRVCDGAPCDHKVSGRWRRTICRRCCAALACPPRDRLSSDDVRLSCACLPDVGRVHDASTSPRRCVPRLARIWFPFFAVLLVSSVILRAAGKNPFRRYLFFFLFFFTS
jgi:hypothetical protein